jgi:hypothetical protein
MIIFTNLFQTANTSFTTCSVGITITYSDKKAAVSNIKKAIRFAKNVIKDASDSELAALRAPSAEASSESEAPFYNILCKAYGFLNVTDSSFFVAVIVIPTLQVVKLVFAV